MPAEARSHAGLRLLHLLLLQLLVMVVVKVVVVEGLKGCGSKDSAKPRLQAR